MALLNPPDILPEAMRYLVRALLALRAPRVDRDELIGLVAPACSPRPWGPWPLRQTMPTLSLMT